MATIINNELIAINATNCTNEIRKSNLVNPYASGNTAVHSTKISAVPMLDCAVVRAG